MRVCVCVYIYIYIYIYSILPRPVFLFWDRPVSRRKMAPEWNSGSDMTLFGRGDDMVGSPH